MPLEASRSVDRLVADAVRRGELPVKVKAKFTDALGNQARRTLAILLR